MRTFFRAQHIVSTIMCRNSRSSKTGGDFGVNGANCSEDGHRSQRMNHTHIGTLPRSSGVRRRAGFFPVL
jgi:hypothetical protein